MNFKKLSVLCLIVLLGGSLLVGCSSGPSKEAKKLFNEQAESLNEKIDYLEECLASDAPTKRISLGYPTAFFHLSVDEKDVWDDADFGDEKEKQVKVATEIEVDAKALYDAAPLASTLTSQDELDALSAVFEELQEKYKDYDFAKAKVELYE